VEVIHFCSTPKALEIWSSDGPSEDAYRADVELEERAEL
jgi:hypothetical protein|tara:strand:+ start:1589 stop:1705 length:117 start_codon:yes stop_codon:yes gene_type:complete